MKYAEDAAKKGRKKRKKKAVTYTMTGKVKRGKLPLWEKILLGFFIFIAVIAIFIYVPPFFYEEASDNSYIPIMPDATAIKAYQTYLKDNPTGDFDEDGLDNSLEAEYGADVWNVDSDGDGVSDYAELFITETSPTEVSNILVKQVKADDDKRNENLGTPYKLDDIIFWPDTYQAKAYGAVVKLSQSEKMIAYRFCYYTGWVRFPYDNIYAYGYRDGVHYELPYKESAKAWKIDSTDEIRIYPSKLKFVHCLKLPFAGTVYLDDNDFGRFLTKILPTKGGFVNCHKAATVDEEPSVENNVTSELRQPFVNKNDFSRLGRNMNTLKDLSWLRKVLEAGHCVSISLYSGNTGESTGIVYGYTEEGDLLIANESLEPVGKLEIKEMAMRMMDKNGTIGYRSWFEWKGLGFDSQRFKDRISFFSTTLTEAENNEIYEEAEMNSDVVGDTDQTPETESKPVQTEPQQPVTEKEPETAAPETETQKQTEIETETEAKDTVITFGF